MAYYCKGCERFVDEDALVGTGEYFKGREHGACPYCYSEDLEEANECELCKTPIVPNELFCDDCKQALAEAWQRAVNYIYDEYSLNDYDKADCVFKAYIESEVF